MDNTKTKIERLEELLYEIKHLYGNEIKNIEMNVTITTKGAMSLHKDVEEHVMKKGFLTLGMATVKTAHTYKTPYGTINIKIEDGADT